MKYESADDVRLRLSGTVVAYQGKPVQVGDVVDKNSVSIQYLQGGNTAVVKWADLDLEPSSLPLGYVQVDDNTLVLCSRRPTRRYKQGLTMENLHAMRVLKPQRGRRGGREEHAPMAEPAPRRATVRHPAGGRGDYPMSPTSDALVKTMMGRFTEVSTAFQKVRTGRAEVQAFSKDWAVGKDDGEMCLVFRGEVVGFVTDTTVRLKPERGYLKESLQLCLV